METLEFLQLHIRTQRRPCARDQLTGARQGSLNGSRAERRRQLNPFDETGASEEKFTPTPPAPAACYSSLHSKGLYVSLSTHPACAPRCCDLPAQLGALRSSRRVRARVRFSRRGPPRDARSRPCGLQRRNKTSLACIKTGWPHSGRVARPSRHFSLWARTPRSLASPSQARHAYASLETVARH